MIRFTQQTQVTSIVQQTPSSLAPRVADGSGKEGVTHCCNVRFWFVKLVTRQKGGFLHRRAVPGNSSIDCSTKVMSTIAISMPWLCNETVLCMQLDDGVTWYRKTNELAILVITKH